jgi:uncharacterized protein YecE (DUF72 family)
MLWIGTSGWQYAHWRGGLYPAGLPQRQWLSHYAGEFATVEINSAFYRLPERSAFEQWAAQTPDDMVFAVKVSRYLTHVKRLKDPAEPVHRFLDRARGLGTRLGPVLLQLPPNLPAGAEALDATLREFGDGVRVAVEPRHPSWWSDEVRSVLTAHGAAMCWADRGGRAVTPLWSTGGFGYLRLHEGRAAPWPSYGRRALDGWLDRLTATFTDAFVYFNNDQEGAAVRDAVTMIDRAHRRGLATPRSTHIATPHA